MGHLPTLPYPLDTVKQDGGNVYAYAYSIVLWVSSLPLYLAICLYLFQLTSWLKTCLNIRIRNTLLKKWKRIPANIRTLELCIELLERKEN